MSIQIVSHPQSVSSFANAQLLFWASAALLGSSTWWRAGNRALPLFVLESLALVLFLALLWRTLDTKQSASTAQPRTWALGLIVATPLWMGSIQLLPWFGSTPTSLAPSQTWLSALAGLPVAAAFAAALTLELQKVHRLLVLCSVVGVLQAILGLVQLPYPGLLFGPNTNAKVLGSFGNKNSLGNYLAMLLPLLWLWAAGGHELVRHRSISQWERWGGRVALMIVMAGLAATLSRAALASGLLTLTFAMALLPAHGTASKGHGFVTVRRWWPVLLVLGGLSLGNWEWLSRFDSDHLSSDQVVRELLRQKTWAAAQEHWPLGTGLGTFWVVFPAYQPPELGRWFVNFAHNDYHQLLMECGILVIPVALALLWLSAWRTALLVRVRLEGAWSHSDRLALACGLGFLAQALHAWVDYPWRIPATAMLGAFLLGIFLRVPKRHSDPLPSA